MFEISRRKLILLSGASLASLLLSPLPLTQIAGFGLPFSGPPGVGSWYLRQWYGNTCWAYRQRHALYSKGQGLHFGVDFFATCGTPVLAIGDGTVLGVDGPYGALPHNLVIQHAGNMASLYGHLAARSTLKVGQKVKKGEQVGISGAPTGADCDTHPHLHLEICSADLSSTFNPIPLISVDWYSLTLGLSGEGLTFEINLDNPGKWQNIHDQPVVHFGGALLNDYSRPWPVSG